MKTIIKNIEIEFSLEMEDDLDYRLELSENSSKTFDAVKIIANGLLIGRYDKILKTHIIITN